MSTTQDIKVRSIPVDLWKRVHIHAAQTGVKLNVVVELALTTYLDHDACPDTTPDEEEETK